VLAAIRRLAAEDQLFRVHREDPALYARARRDHGSWAAALTAAGLDPREAVARARRRAREGRATTRPLPPNTHE